MGQDHLFDFERLEVYQLAVQFVDEVFSLTSAFPNRLQYSLGDQFRRAALSIINNIAEGSGFHSKGEKARFYGYALYSARECIPSFAQNVIACA